MRNEWLGRILERLQQAWDLAEADSIGSSNPGVFKRIKAIEDAMLWCEALLTV
jgi:hypothetical protein